MTVVAGALNDAPAVSLVDKVLSQAGVERIDQVSEIAPPKPHTLTVYVGGHSENARAAAAITAPGIDGPSKLPAEGYVLGRRATPRPRSGSGWTHGDDTQLQRGRPNPDGRLFGQVTTRIRHIQPMTHTA